MDAQMTEPTVTNLRKASTAIYVAVEKDVADDISNLFKWAASRIEQDAKRIEELEGALRGLANAADGLAFAERDMRLAVGNTNYSVLQHWIGIGRAALSPHLGQEE